MQEEVEQRIVSLMISCGKLGEQEFRKAVAKLLEQLKNDHQKHQHSKADQIGKSTRLNSSHPSSSRMPSSA